MSFFHHFLWVIVGVGLALLFFKFQQWSVQRIDPNKNRKSSALIIGGALVRWGLVFLAFVQALKISYISLFLVFFSFMFVRLIFLVKWNKTLSIDQERIN